jgi:tetratricopeptide (TPR) repeat protein
MEKDGFFRRVAGRMLDDEPARQIAEQRHALSQNPDWAEGYYHLAQLLRVQHQRDEALRLLLTCLEKEPSFAPAHLALGEIYLAENDLARARQHAEMAAAFGEPRLLAQMRRHGAV